MTSAAVNDLGALTRAWRDFQTRTPVELGTINSERHYQAMANLMNKLVDDIGGRDTHALTGLLDIVILFVRDYEERNIELPNAEPPTILRFLMEQHNVRQANLVEIFGSRSNVSEVLNGKREIDARQARALGARFRVSAGVFI